MIMFILILISILLGGHFFIYLSLVKFLNIINPSVKLWLAGVLLFLSFSFILSSFLAHYNNGFLARTIYFVFSFWVGAGWNLSMALGISWIVFGTGKFFNYNFDYKYLAIYSLVFMIVLSAWGAWNAYNPKIINVTVEINNLPEEWKNKKVVQISDVHLGHIYRANFLKNIVAKISQENPDIVFITGDLFDGMDGQLTHLVDSLNDVKAKNGIYFVTGNHETYLGVERAIETLKETPVKILNNEVVEIDGVQVVGINYPQRGETENFSDKIRKVANLDFKKPSILLYHNPNSAQDAKELGIDLQLAGHSHKGQIFPFGIITYWIYGKYHNGLTKEGDFNIYTSSGAGTWGPMMRTSGRSEVVVFNFR